MIWGNKVSLKVGNKKNLKILFDHHKLEIKGKTTKIYIKKLKAFIDHPKKNQGENKMTKCNHN
jgi:hypothetical protein